MVISLRLGNNKNLSLALLLQRRVEPRLWAAGALMVVKRTKRRIITYIIIREKFGANVHSEES